MPELYGTKRADHLYVDDQDWLIRGGRGTDEILGADGTDEIYGGDGRDTINNYGGDDFMAGGRGNDALSDVVGFNEVRGGVGDDTIGATGNVFGGPGDDYLEVYGGIYHGDDQLGLSRGNDTFHVNAPTNAPFFPMNSFLIGGQDADRYEIEFANDGIQTRIDVLDFRQDEGDSFDVMVRPPQGQLGDTLFGLQVALDTDGNGFLDGKDPASEYGVTWADPTANAVCLLTTDGDLFALWGTQSVKVAEPPTDFLT